MSDTGQDHRDSTGGMAAESQRSQVSPSAPDQPNMAERSLSLVQSYDIDKRHPVRQAPFKEETEPERMKGVIYITGHRTLKVGPYHTAIEFTPHGSDDTAWISAGPEDGRLVGGIGTRTNRVRESDTPKKNRVFGIIIPPPGVTAHAHFERLKASSRSYCQCIDYDTVPEIADSFNSNSFTTGLAHSNGGRPSIDMSQFVGGARPVPAEYFE